MSNMNTLGQKMKKEFALRAVRQILLYMTLTFDSKVKKMIYTQYIPYNGVISRANEISVASGIEVQIC